MPRFSKALLVTVVLVVSVVCLVFYGGRRFGRDTATHLRDQSSVPEKAKTLVMAAELPSSLDSIFFYDDGMMRGPDFLKCRIPDPSDFKVYLSKVKTKSSSYRKVEDIEGLRIPDEIKSWFVLDEKRNPQIHALPVAGNYLVLYADMNEILVVSIPE